ncbi:hypothetical protein Tco_1317203 [Tanacetum coccineum]
MNRRKKHFVKLRAEEIRRNPPTKAQKRNQMSTYLNNMDGYKHSQLKSKSYDEIQKLFDKEMKRVNTFVDMNSEVVKGRYEIVKDDEVAIDVIPLATKPLVIVEYQIDKDGRMGYFKLIRADGSSKRNGVTRTKKYEELSATQKIQADCDLKATNIIFQGLLSDRYSLITHYRVAKDLWERVQLLMQDSGLAVLVFKQGDDPIDSINKMMSFLGDKVHLLLVLLEQRLTSQEQDGIIQRKRDATWFRDKVLLVEAQGCGKVLNEEELEFLADSGVAEGPVTQTVITHNATYQADDLDAYDYDCDDFSTAKAVLMDNLSSYGSYVLSEVPHSENTHNDMLNQSGQEMQYSEQTHLVNYPKNEITSDSNIIPYSQYLLETQNAAVQDTNSSRQQDAMILFVFE